MSRTPLVGCHISPAREHAQFLAQLAASTDMGTRHVLVVLREPPAPGGETAAARNAVLAAAMRQSARCAPVA